MLTGKLHAVGEAPEGLEPACYLSGDASGCGLLWLVVADIEPVGEVRRHRGVENVVALAEGQVWNWDIEGGQHDLVVFDEGCYVFEGCPGWRVGHCVVVVNVDVALRHLLVNPTLGV